jgi:predicted nucleic acid-binding protein
MQVLDASVAVKWVLDEPGREASLTLLDSYEAGTEDFVAPRTIREEVASALSKRFRRGQLALRQAEAAFQFLERRMPVLIDDVDLVGEALNLSLSHQLSLWECLYLALAIRHRCNVITADRRFYRAARQHYPFVTLLGS